MGLLPLQDFGPEAKTQGGTLEVLVYQGWIQGVNRVANYSPFGLLLLLFFFKLIEFFLVDKKN